MTFSVVTNGAVALRDMVADMLIATFQSHGDVLVPAGDGIDFALNLTDQSSPRAVRRRSRSVFVFSLIEDDRPDEGLKSRCYTALIRTLSNLLLCVVPSVRSNRPEIYFTTPEAGFYHCPFDPEAVYERLQPIATSRFATDNIFTPDLPPRLCNGSPVVAQLAMYGKELDAMGVLPTPFPLREVLTEEALRQLYKIYGITGASYGNLSAREAVPELSDCTFWMTGRGIDKSNIRVIGRDVLLVHGFDHELGAALVSQPPDADPVARVSVDAVEHHLIYTTFPGVGAIVHAHAWLDGVLCTRQNYPCGTGELAREVVDLLRQTPDPCRAAVGLKNHGLTITGVDCEDIFRRIRGKLLTEVRMFA